MTSGPGPVSRGQPGWKQLTFRRFGASRRDRRQGVRRGIPFKVAVQGGNTSTEDVTYVTYEITGISRLISPIARVRTAGQPLKLSNYDSELNDIFLQLQELDDSISNANNSIDELKQTTRSIIGRMLGKA
jgi:hypothetical protein